MSWVRQLEEGREMKEGARYDVYDTIVWKFYRFGPGSLSPGEMGDLSSRKLNPNFSSPPPCGGYLLSCERIERHQ